MSNKQRTLDLIRALSGLSEEYLRVVAAGTRSEGHRRVEYEVGDHFARAFGSGDFLLLVIL